MVKYLPNHEQRFPPESNPEKAENFPLHQGYGNKESIAAWAKAGNI
jgi:hypothetical protein